MRIHHLDCGTLCPHGRKLINGEGGLLERSSVVCHCLAIETDGGIVLVDTGFGSADAREPARLGLLFRLALQPRPALETTAITRLKELGFAAGDVTHIVATHLDLDHAGGLGDFPDAEVHVLGAELAAARHPRLRERSRYVAAQWAHGPRWVEYGSGGDEWFGFESARILPGLDAEIVLVPLTGHSRGHTGVAVRDGERWILHCGDAYFNHRELETPPYSPPALRSFQTINVADGRSRKRNRERLRELVVRKEDEVEAICAHDPWYLERARAARPSGSAV